MYGDATQRETATGNYSSYLNLIKVDLSQMEIPSGVALEDGLDEGEAISLALANNADFQVALSQMNIDQADLLQARQWSNPIFSLIFPYGPRQWEMVASMPLHELWIKPQRKATEGMKSEANVQSIVASGLDLVRDVRLGLIDVEKNQKLIERTEASANAQGALVHHLESRNQLGLVDFRMIAQAKQVLLKFEISQASFEADRNAANSRLRNLIGLSEYPGSLTFHPIDRSTSPVLDAEKRKSVALDSRPDYRAAELELEAAAREQGIVRSEFYSIIGKLDVDFPNGNGKVAPGLDIPLPIFNQGKASNKRAQAIWRQKAARFSSVRHRVFSEVDIALENYSASDIQLRIIQSELIPSMEAELSRLQDALDENLIDASNFIQAQLDLIGAQSQMDQVRALFLVAIVELEWATGSKAQ